MGPRVWSTRLRDSSKERTVAVKVLSEEYSGSEEQKERFVRGIKTMAPIRHENIVRLYAAGMQDKYCWVAMEHVDGESLTQVIERIGVSGMLDWKLAFHVGVQIARALDEAAQHEIIHRNVTPQNILLRSSDNVAKLCDLTLAKALQGTLARQVTQPGELVGEVAYMSPERTRGQENVDGRSDIYGLGATLYALLDRSPSVPGRVVARNHSQHPQRRTRQAEEVPVGHPGHVSGSHIANDRQAARGSLPDARRIVARSRACWEVQRDHFVRPRVS